MLALQATEKIGREERPGRPYAPLCSDGVVGQGAAVGDVLGVFTSPVCSTNRRGGSVYVREIREVCW